VSWPSRFRPFQNQRRIFEAHFVKLAVRDLLPVSVLRKPKHGFAFRSTLGSAAS